MVEIRKFAAEDATSDPDKIETDTSCARGFKVESTVAEVATSGNTDSGCPDPCAKSASDDDRMLEESSLGGGTTKDCLRLLWRRLNPRFTSLAASCWRGPIDFVIDEEASFVSSLRLGSTSNDGMLERPIGHEIAGVERGLESICRGDAMDRLVI